jgi:hypothetical protein
MMARGDGRHRAEDVLAPRMEVRFDGAALQQQSELSLTICASCSGVMAARSVIPQRLAPEQHSTDRAIITIALWPIQHTRHSTRSSRHHGQAVVRPVRSCLPPNDAALTALMKASAAVGFVQQLPASDVGVICHANYLDSSRTRGLMGRTSP